MSAIRSTLCALALAAAAAAAQAGFVHVQFDSPIFNGVPAPYYDAVTITYPRQDGSGPRSVGTAAGRFQGRASNLRGVDPGIFVDSLDDLFMYCYDVYELVGSGWSVDYEVKLDGETARTLDFLGAVNAVLGPGDPYAWLHPRTAGMAAAIQLGIWESKYDSGAWSLAAGSFSATGLMSETQGYLSSFFAVIDSTNSLDGRYVMTLEAAGVQDMITGDPPPAVPEPATLALVAAGAALALWTMRWRGQQREPIGDRRP